MNIKTFTGGIFDTNCFLIENGERNILIDAPQDSAAWLEESGYKVSLLLLTHGHIDHVADAARIKREHGCRVGYHPDGIRLLTEKNFLRNYGFDFDVEPVTADLSIVETASANYEGIDFQVLEVPGHCPGSVCFFSSSERLLFGGDVLFAGAVGRWDLPGGDRDLLFSGIRAKVLPLGDDVTVLSGHGPSTTIGRERASNPYLVGAEWR